MKRLGDAVQFMSGSPQFRINVTTDIEAPEYVFYSQSELESDLIDIEIHNEDMKVIRTSDDVNILNEGDVVFSLISGRATYVRTVHQGYLYTQNFVKLIPDEQIEKKYMVYLLNESQFIRRQWQAGLQGTMVLKYTVRQLRELELPNLPSYEKQKMIGNIYFDQLRLCALKKRVADAEKILVLDRLEGIKDYE